MAAVSSAAPPSSMAGGQMTSSAVSMSIEQQQQHHHHRHHHHLQSSDMDLSALQQAASSSSSSTTTTAATFAKRDSPSAVSTPASSAPSPASTCGVSTPASSTSISATTNTTTTNLTGGPPIAPRPSVAPRPAPIRAASVSSQGGAMSPVDCPTPQGGPLSMTSKEWVIPPRPKPGRKPATDTPPTKRKAQNRAAQRAFRERRAARVGELEDQLEDQKEEHDRVVRELQGRISHFEVEVQNLQSRCRWLEDMLEKEKARNAARNVWDNMSPQSVLPQQSNGFTLQQQQQPTQQTQLAPKVDSVPIAEPRPTAQPFSISQIISPPEEVAQSPLDVTCGSCQSIGSCACAEELMQSSNVLMGCGGCVPEGRCACLEESIRVLAAADLKRPLPPSSPSLGPDEKRHKSNAGVEDVQLETDFTALFSSKKPETTVPDMTPLPAPVQQQSQQQSQPINSVEMHESCGFCKDGTYCVCAESVALSAASMTVASVVQQVQMHTPPPSENDVVPMPMEITATGAVKLPSFGSVNRANNNNNKNDAQSKPPVKTGGCGPGGPGTCAQCLADPKSGLFCRSLAANFERNKQQTGSSSSSAPPSGCCGGGGRGGGCCKTEKPDEDEVVPINLNRYKNTNQQPAQAPSNPFSSSSSSSSSSNNVSASNFALSLSCAEAYKTIASHRHFEEAADDIGSWLPKLRAVPANPPLHRGSVSMQQSSTGKAWAPIEVEAASIMAVLKGFDVRFGRGE